MVGRALFGLCALAAAGAAPDAATAADKPARPNAHDPDRIVCKSIGESGSRLRRTRICHSLAEWAERRRRTQELIDRMQTNHGTNG